MATEFISIVKSSGGDYTTPTLWSTACDSDITSALTRVYSVTKTNSGAADNATLYLWRSGSYLTGNTCTLNHAKITDDRIMVKTIVWSGISATQTGDFWSASNANQDNGYTVTSTIGSGTGDTVIPVAEIDGTITLSEGFILYGTTWVTSATNYIVIRSANATKHNADNALCIGNAAGTLSLSGGTVDTVRVQENYVRFEDIDIDYTGTGNSLAVQVVTIDSGGSDIRFTRCIMRNNSTGTGSNTFIVSDADATVTCTDCIIYGIRARAAYVNACTSATFHRCLFYTSYASTGVGLGVNTSQTVHAIGCYAAATANDYNGTFATLSYCAASDATGDPAGLDNLAAASQFTTVATDGTEDWRLQASSALISAGVAIGGVTTDICGTAIDASPDVGPYEYPAVGVSATAAVTLGGLEVEGYVLGAPYDLYCADTSLDVESGSENPAGITTLTPWFSALVRTVGANITQVQIQVSAVDDADFSEDVSWDSGWITLWSAVVDQDRTEGIEYGE